MTVVLSTDAEIAYLIISIGQIREQRGSLFESKIALGEGLQTSPDHPRIIDSALTAGDFFERLVYAHGWPVGAVGGHGFHDISHRQNPGFQQNPLAPEA